MHRNLFRQARGNTRAPSQSSPGRGAVGQLQRSATSGGGGSAGAADAVASAAGSTGVQLPPGLQPKLEAALGTGLGDVRVHTDSASAAAADAVGANAYAVGQDVHFAAGAYQPDSQDGQRLIAHEVAHTVQQRGTPPTFQGDLEVSSPGDAHEVEAEDFAHAFVGGGEAPALCTVSEGSVARAVVQRDGEPDKELAQDELLEFQSDSLDFIEGNRFWMSNNWIDYLKKTSQNPRLGWSDGQVASVASNALGNLLTELGEKLIKKGSAAAAGAIFGSALPGAGTAIGFCVGVLVETGASLIFEAITGKTDADEAAAAASVRTGDLILAQLGSLETAAAKARGELLAVYEHVQTKLTAATTQAEVDEIEEWADEESDTISEPAPSDDRSLTTPMLADWVREHAGDEEDANKRTSETQWENARTDAFGEGDSLDGHAELFAYQTRGEWQRLGLATDEAQAMIDKTRSITAEAEDPAAATQAYFDDKTVTFSETSDARALFDELDDHYDLMDWASERIAVNDFVLTIKLDLTTADGACFVDTWIYDLQIFGGTDPWYATTNPTWSSSPD